MITLAPGGMAGLIERGARMVCRLRNPNGPPAMCNAQTCHFCADLMRLTLIGLDKEGLALVPREPTPAMIVLLEKLMGRPDQVRQIIEAGNILKGIA